jgi:simple sugar transport system substrate-binding protein
MRLGGGYLISRSFYFKKFGLKKGVLMKKTILIATVIVLAFAIIFSMSLAGCKTATQETAAATTAAAETSAAATTVAAETTAATKEVVMPTTADGKRDVAAYLKTLDNSKFEVVQANKATGHRWFDDMANGIEQVGKDLGFKSSNIAPDAGDAALQNKIMEDLIARMSAGTSAIICVPNDAKAMDPAAGKANEKGIITIGYEGTTMKNITYDLEPYDNAAFGATMMEALAKSMGGEGEYAVTVGLLTMEVHMVWANAAVEYQKANYPNMKLVTDPYIESGNDAKKAYTNVQELLKGYPDLKGILCCEGATPPAGGQIVEEKNLIGKLFVSGLALPATVKNYLESGALSSVSCSNPINQSYCLGVVALAALQGVPLMEGDYLGRTGYNIVKIDGKVFYAEGAITVTKDNVSDPAMDF